MAGRLPWAGGGWLGAELHSHSSASCMPMASLPNPTCCLCLPILQLCVIDTRPRHELSAEQYNVLIQVGCTALVCFVFAWLLSGCCTPAAASVGCAAFTSTTAARSERRQLASARTTAQQRCNCPAAG